MGEKKNYKMGKKQSNNKRVKRELFTQVEVPVLVCSREVWEHPWAHALKFPSLRRKALK
jgi:hypothetical protein